MKRTSSSWNYYQEPDASLCTLSLFSILLFFRWTTELEMYIQEKSKKKKFIEKCIDKLFDLCRVQF